MLTSPAITQTMRESAPKALLAEWLGSWFNGASHAVGTDPAVVFPQATIAFDVGPVGNDASVPLDGVEIRVMAAGAGRSQRKWNAEETGKTVFEDVAYVFTVRAGAPVVGKRNQLADQTADLLGAVLRNPVTAAPLSAKGIGKVRPGAAQTMTAGELAVRMIYCRMRFTYLLGWDEGAA